MTGLAYGFGNADRVTVCTPRYILEPLIGAWGRVAFDPCAPPPRIESQVGAEHCISLGPDEDPSKPGQGGLRYKWPDRTFINPPYKYLKMWLAHEHYEPHARRAWLIPVRSHRPWWRAWAKTMDAIVLLPPLKFVGFDAAFPAPVCLGYKGRDYQEVAYQYYDQGLGLPMAVPEFVY